jgi:hypothetical protein
VRREEEKRLTRGMREGTLQMQVALEMLEENLVEVMGVMGSS